MANAAVINVANRHSDQVSIDGRGKLPTAILNFTAADTIAPKRVVKFAPVPGQVVQSSAPTDAHIGVYLGDVVARLNDEVPIGLNDIVEVEAGAAISQGDTLSVDAVGRAVTGGTGDLDWGVALEPASGAGAIIKAKIGGTTSAGGIPESEKGQPGGVATLDGSGKVPASELPPLQHDVGEAANQAGMLALSVTAPAMCLRTDFSPPHIFFLTADPASTLANWTDTGELGAGGANPTALVGPAAINGASAFYMRADAAPGINLTATYPWTGPHSHTQPVTFIAGKNYEVVAANIATDDRLIFRSTSAIEARYWFDSFAMSTGISLAEAGVERLFLGTDGGSGVVFDTTTYGFRLKTNSATNFASLDTSLLTADRAFQFPDAAGTLALTSGFASGTYAPTVTPGANAASAVANGPFIYSRVGSTVQVCGELAVTATAVGPTLVDFSLPVAPPNFANTHQLNGSGAATTGSETTPLYARSNIGTTNGTINWIAPNTSAHTIHFVAMYTTT